MEAVEEEVVLVREAGPGLEGVDEGAGHDRPAVQHRIVRLPSLVQADLVEVPATGLPPDVFLDHVSSQLVQVDGVGERFAGKIFLIVNYSSAQICGPEYNTRGQRSFMRNLCLYGIR